MNSSLNSLLINRIDLDFLLNDVLQSGLLLERDRYADHSSETFTATIDTAQKLAQELFAPHNRKADENEPHFDGVTVKTLPEIKAAVVAFAQAGFLAATHDYGLDGMQLPVTISQSCLALFRAANVSTSAYCFLTAANANLIRSFGTDEQKRRYLPALLQGRWFGTMALTEPQAGSSVSDLRCTATPQADGRYLIKGQKIFISGGDHDLGENIIHLVLARLPDAPLGSKGLSLFIVPKFRVNADGLAGEPNDVALAGLIHKMGYRGTTSAMLNFGEQDACMGELIGEPGMGLNCMFHMMNEARIGVGMGASMLAYTAYLHALDYAKNREQGRLIGQNDPASPPVAIIEHADVRRMLLTQKSYVEGALHLCLYAARLVDDERTQPDEDARREAAQVLALLIPIVKSWPARYGLAANDLAIQVYGGYGYTREYPVEQFYRDNRLNQLHEGTHGIQSLDLLNRKVGMKEGLPLRQLHARVLATIDRAHQVAGLKSHADQLQTAWQELLRTTEVLLAAASEDLRKASANSAAYLDLFGHHVLAWLWLEQAVAAHALLEHQPHMADFYQGKLAACTWFYHTELATTQPQHLLLRDIERHALNVKAEWL
ncbi:acyl-CoA dehydrogenase [Pollutimonas subterranea]|uniref:Acyl-CoA dehydrogenase n=1 Tax=Pollutimonas subterranea TaxID=2045210 RepID=A0A2N4U054_9BURK|nr:acyl-CoA dehydrogenase [Pollutimonas subterranea]PLC48399.1 acyl-CoA dehydrogenase [Pollutimonas subterranea]